MDSYAHLKKIDWFDKRRKQEKIMFESFHILGKKLI